MRKKSWCKMEQIIGFWPQLVSTFGPQTAVHIFNRNCSCTGVFALAPFGCNIRKFCLKFVEKKLVWGHNIGYKRIPLHQGRI